MPRPIETEAKFICPEEIAKDHIADFVQAEGIAIKWNNIIYNEDEYWDTNDHQLFKADISLRLRKISKKNHNKHANEFIGTLKLPKKSDGVVMERYEMECDIKTSPNNDNSSSNISERFILELPEDIKQILIEYSPDIKSFAPVLNVFTERQTADISIIDLINIEFAFDQSIFRGRQGQVNRREIELELKSGNQTDFLTFAAKMQNKFNLQPSMNSKYAFGVRAVTLCDI